MTRLTCLLLLLALALPASAEVVVVAHPDHPLKEVTAKVVSDLYLGRLRATEGGERLLLLDQPRDSKLRELFFHKLVAMTLRRVNAYWARLQFSGDIQPPLALADSSEVIDTIRGNRLAIGYVEANRANATGLRILLRLED